MRVSRLAKGEHLDMRDILIPLYVEARSVAEPRDTHNPPVNHVPYPNLNIHLRFYGFRLRNVETSK